MRYNFTIFFWIILTSYGTILTFGKPIPCQTTSFLSFFLGLTFLGMMWELDEREKRYLTKRRKK